LEIYSTFKDDSTPHINWHVENSCFHTIIRTQMKGDCYLSPGCLGILMLKIGEWTSQRLMCNSWLGKMLLGSWPVTTFRPVLFFDL